MKKKRDEPPVSTFSADMNQFVNLAGLRILPRVLANPALATPHLALPSIAHVDFRRLRRAGVEFLVFDKDNTVTAPYSLEVFPSLAVCTLLQRYT